MSSGDQKQPMVRALVFTATGMLVGMSLYEAIKEFLLPHMSRWDSHLITIVFSTVIATVAAYIVRRNLTRQNQQLTAALKAKDTAEVENVRIIRDLREAAEQVKLLSGMLPICAHCKKIRDDQGYWSSVEQYISNHAEVQFSHGICPECLQRYYADLREDDESGSRPA